MELRSGAFGEGAAIDRRHAWPDCGGRNLSPALSWSGSPEGTRSFVLTCFDPDAARGWWHWAVHDIPADVDGLPEGGPLPHGAVETDNSFGSSGWGGPCPPPGRPHRYVFTLYALPEEKLPVHRGGGAGRIAETAERRALASATLTGTFQSR